jgi:hypothetical protein
MSLENIIEYKSMKSWYINDIKNVKVLEVYENNDIFEIVYMKDGLQKSLTIYHWCSFGPRGNGCWFELSGVGMMKSNLWGRKHISKRLVNIDTIVEINIYYKPIDNGEYQDLQIVYKDKEGNTHNYLLNSAPDEEEVHRLDIYANRESKLKKVIFDGRTFPKELYSTKIYKEILAFALKAHGGQKTPNGLPYSFHIVSVANEIINSLSMHKISYDEANVAIACALLHDVNEDTEQEVSKYTIEFPSQNVDIVTRGVAALTKDTTLPSKQEQMKDSIERLKEMPHCVQMIKLADRITNLAPAPLFWNKAKRKAYVDEAKFILRELRESNKYLAGKLQDKIDNYEFENIRDGMGWKIVDDYLLFLADDKQLILDKSHKNYLKTFKALNRLNEYSLKKYDIKLFDSWKNIEAKDINEYTNRVEISYVIEALNTKSLLNLNKQTDEKIDKYFTTILEGESVIK